jgi:hypothetical protein
MKLGDFYLNKKMIEEAEQALSNLSPDQIEDVKLVTKGSAFLASMIVEIFESDGLMDAKMDEKKIADVVIKLLGTGCAIGLLNVASKTNDAAVFINAFKHYFELIIKQFMDAKNVNN